MTVVVDASVAIKFVVKENDHAAAIALLRGRADELASPDFLLIEVANILWKKARIGEIDGDYVPRGLGDIKALFGQFIPSSDLVDRALAFATALDHPVYDCLYLACAERLDANLITADGRLLKAVAATRTERNVVALSGVAT